ncbi:MAG: GAF domain-containing protein [Candidatus Sulfotelmatobacter sp.]
MIADILHPLEAVLETSFTPEAVCVVLAEIFHVQSSEVALLRLEQDRLHFLYPKHLQSTGAIPISSSAVAAHTALSKKAEIFNNFAFVKHARIFESIRPLGAEVSEEHLALPIQKLMSVPIIENVESTVLGVIQISRKGTEARFIPDFTREEMHDLELAADLLATAPFLLSLQHDPCF